MFSIISSGTLLACSFSRSGRRISSIAPGRLWALGVSLSVFGQMEKDSQDWEHKSSCPRQWCARTFPPSRARGAKHFLESSFISRSVSYYRRPARRIKLGPLAIGPAKAIRPACEVVAGGVASTAWAEVRESNMTTTTTTTDWLAGW